MNNNAIGIIGGSGLYRLFTSHEVSYATTSYGSPSSPVQIGSIGETKVYFISRHGLNHEIPPHKVNYKANIQALYNLGVRRIIATHALGALNPSMSPGDFVISDQFVNKAFGRDDTFFNGPDTVHISTSDPFCEDLRTQVEGTIQELKYKYHDKGIMAIIQGPRFSTRAENSLLYKEGNDVISMTGYPECVLAREKGICYVSVGFITDIACVLGSSLHPQNPTTHTEVVRTFEASIEKIISVLKVTVPKINSDNFPCNCMHSLEGAKN
ncbi:MTAP family purine nucleoside phosphorylase [Bacillus toyonensis]|uniref:MTAP family purine nucleoside phosphorylase n=1 Tax=Bacillus toyonensis TaxID=155322 RepID=UPI003D24B68B